MTDFEEENIQAISVTMDEPTLSKKRGRPPSIRTEQSKEIKRAKQLSSRKTQVTLFSTLAEALEEKSEAKEGAKRAVKEALLAMEREKLSARPGTKKPTMMEAIIEELEEELEEEVLHDIPLFDELFKATGQEKFNSTKWHEVYGFARSEKEYNEYGLLGEEFTTMAPLLYSLGMSVDDKGTSLFEMVAEADMIGQYQILALLLMAEIDESLIILYLERYNDYREAMEDHYSTLRARPHECSVSMRRVRLKSDALQEVLMDIMGMDKEHPMRNPFFNSRVLAHQMNMFAMGVNPIGAPELSKLGLSEIYFELFDHLKEDPVQVEYMREMEDTLKAEGAQAAEERNARMSFAEKVVDGELERLIFLSERRLINGVENGQFDMSQMAELYKQPIGRRAIDDFIAHSRRSAEGEEAEEEFTTVRAKMDEKEKADDGINMEERLAEIATNIGANGGSPRGKTRREGEEEEEEGEEGEEGEFTEGADYSLEGNISEVASWFMNRVNKDVPISERITLEEAKLVIWYFREFKVINNQLEKMEKLGYKFEQSEEKKRIKKQILGKYKAYKAAIFDKLGANYVATAYELRATEEKAREAILGTAEEQGLHKFYLFTIRYINDIFLKLEDEDERIKMIEELGDLRHPLTKRKIKIDMNKGIPEDTIAIIYEDEEYRKIRNNEIELDQVGVKEIEYLLTHKQSVLRRRDPSSANIIKRNIVRLTDVMSGKNQHFLAAGFRAFLHYFLAPVTLQSVQVGLANLVVQKRGLAAATAEYLASSKEGAEVARHAARLAREYEEELQEAVQTIQAELSPEAKKIEEGEFLLPRPQYVKKNKEELGIYDLDEATHSPAAIEEHKKYLASIGEQTLLGAAAIAGVEQDAVIKIAQKAMPTEEEAVAKYLKKGILPEDVKVKLSTGETYTIEDLPPDLSPEAKLHELAKLEHYDEARITLETTANSAFANCANFYNQYAGTLPGLTKTRASTEWGYEKSVHMINERGYYGIWEKLEKDETLPAGRAAQVMQQMSAKFGVEIVEGFKLHPETHEPIAPKIERNRALDSGAAVIHEMRYLPEKFDSTTGLAFAMLEEGGFDVTKETTIEAGVTFDVPISKFPKDIRDRLPKEMEFFPVPMQLKARTTFENYFEKFREHAGICEGARIDAEGALPFLIPPDSLTVHEQQLGAMMRVLYETNLKAGDTISKLADLSKLTTDVIQSQAKTIVEVKTKAAENSAVAVLAESLTSFIDAPINLFAWGFPELAGTLGNIAFQQRGAVSGALGLPYVAANHIAFIYISAHDFLSNMAGNEAFAATLKATVPDFPFTEAPRPSIDWLAARSDFKSYLDFRLPYLAARAIERTVDGVYGSASGVYSGLSGILSGAGWMFSSINSGIAGAARFSGSLLNYFIFKQLKFKLLDNIPVVGKYASYVTDILERLGYSSVYDLFRMAYMRKLFFYIADTFTRRSSKEMDEVRRLFREQFELARMTEQERRAEKERKQREREEEEEEEEEEKMEVEEEEGEGEEGAGGRKEKGKERKTEEEEEAEEEEFPTIPIYSSEDDEVASIERRFNAILLGKVRDMKVKWAFEDRRFETEHEVEIEVLKLEEELTMQFINTHLEAYDGVTSSFLRLFGVITSCTSHHTFLTYVTWAISFIHAPLAHSIMERLPEVLEVVINSVFPTELLSQIAGPIASGHAGLILVAGYLITLFAGLYATKQLLGLYRHASSAPKRVLKEAFNLLPERHRSILGLFRFMGTSVTHPVTTTHMIRHAFSNLVVVKQEIKRMLTAIDCRIIERDSTRTMDISNMAEREEIGLGRAVGKLGLTVAKHFGTAVWRQRYRLALGAIIFSSAYLANYFMHDLRSKYGIAGSEMYTARGEKMELIKQRLEALGVEFEPFSQAVRKYVVANVVDRPTSELLKEMNKQLEEGSKVSAKDISTMMEEVSKRIDIMQLLRKKELVHSSAVNVATLARAKKEILSIDSQQMTRLYGIATETRKGGMKLAEDFTAQLVGSLNTVANPEYGRRIKQSGAKGWVGHRESLLGKPPAKGWLEGATTWFLGE